MASKNTNRDGDGRYTHSMDAVCRCGHRMGEHAAGRRSYGGECLVNHDSPTGYGACDCGGFRAAPAPKFLAEITSTRTGTIAYLDARACPTDHPEHAFATEDEACGAFAEYARSIFDVTGALHWTCSVYPA